MATLRMISREGINNVTMDDVAREAGLSKGGLAYYYSSKYELFHESFREFFRRIFERSRKNMDNYESPLEKLVSFGWLYNWDDPDVYIGYPLLLECKSLAVHDDNYRKLYHDWLTDWIEMEKPHLIEGVESGIFSIDNIDEAAMTIPAIYNGIATRWYLDKNRHNTDWAIRASCEAVSSYLLCEKS